jgi:hypothetical protein
MLRAVLVALLVVSCAAAESAAKKDPMKCERDPKCKDKGRAADCWTQCTDDPACVDRCQQMNATSGATGPH